ncbi:4Fe-4S dicluster domain-containing protein [Desulfopila inferna]|uniref:4Fe-4S dicluster domain-containing protein n=1 Tax=Desulfopila inferna TaxID=468528 RepID=UPI00196669A0|nr:4Fe-4S dicluster domain-containing protein [Desulfopila inferna]MBM9605188.1 4Fe-4S dicluster domain-containing protein [Desulfopila inferna]
MAKFIKLSFNKGELNTRVSELFSDMLENNAVDAVLAPMAQPRKGVMQTLVTSKEHIQNIDPFAPVVPVNGAKVASSLTASPSGKKIAMVLRSCEVRALIELVKLKQANLDDVLLVGMDCLGRYENTDFLKYQADGGTAEAFIENSLNGKTEAAGNDIAGACKICEYPSPANVDIHLRTIGAGSGTLYVEALSEKGEEALSKSGAKFGDAPGGLDEAVKKVAAGRTEARDALFAAYREETATFDALEDKLAACINCYNCRVACPVCYCKECVFVTDTFRHKGEQFIGWANSNGTLKMPTDTSFYHLTRMTHIAAFCVGCGQCTSACPNDIELMPIFRTAAEKAQARFEYEAGRSVDEPQPLSVFDSDELMEVTGQVK